MFPLEVILAINSPRAIARRAIELKGHFTQRECSACFSRGGVVLHAALQRSTVFLRDSHPNWNDACVILKGKNQEAKNEFIECAVADTSDAVAFRRALEKLKPRYKWEVSTLQHAGLEFRAVKKGQALRESIASTSLADLFKRLRRF